MCDQHENLPQLPPRPRGDADQPSVPQPLLTVDDVAAWLRVRPGFVYEQARKGELRSVKVGRYSRFQRADVERYLAACSLNAR